MDQDDRARDFYGLATTTSIYQPIHQGMPLHHRDRRRRCALLSMGVMAWVAAEIAAFVLSLLL
jgi:hypothetical protein